jgi:hypothetical protein
MRTIFLKRAEQAVSMIGTMLQKKEYKEYSEGKKMAQNLIRVYTVAYESGAMSKDAIKRSIKTINAMYKKEVNHISFLCTHKIHRPDFISRSKTELFKLAILLKHLKRISK